MRRRNGTGGRFVLCLSRGVTHIFAPTPVSLNLLLSLPLAPDLLLPGRVRHLTTPGGVCVESSVPSLW